MHFIWRLFVEEALMYGTCSHGISQFYLHTHTFFRNRNEPYLPWPSILPGSVNEYQLRLGRQRQVWLIPIAEGWKALVRSSPG